MQGCLPSHFIFFLLHSSHALVTRRRFCRGVARGACEPGVPAGDACQADDCNEFGSSSTLESGEEGLVAEMEGAIGIDMLEVLVSLCMRHRGV